MQDQANRVVMLDPFVDRVVKDKALNSLFSGVNHFFYKKIVSLSSWMKLKPNVTDGEIVWMVNQFPQLKHVDLSWCENITDGGFSPLSALSQLQHICLRGCKITDEGLVF